MSWVVPSRTQLVAALCVTFWFAAGEAWISAGAPSRLIIRNENQQRISTFRLNMVEAISLKNIDADHEAVGSEMAGSIQRWLDFEWMPQQIHADMGESAKQTYIKCRKDGVVDLSDVMIQVADDLSADWKAYDAEAFVSPWDISNYVSDYLTKLSGSEGCECSSKIH